MTDLKTRSRVADRLTLLVERFATDADSVLARDTTEEILDKFVDWVLDAGLEKIRGEGHDI